MNALVVTDDDKDGPLDNFPHGCLEKVGQWIEDEYEVVVALKNMEALRTKWQPTKFLILAMTM